MTAITRASPMRMARSWHGRWMRRLLSRWARRRGPNAAAIEASLPQGSFIAGELLAGLDVGIAGRALHQRPQALGDRPQHPDAVQSLVHQVPFLARVVDQVEDQRPLGLDDRAAGALGVAQHDLHGPPFDRHHLGVGPKVDDMIAAGGRALAEQEPRGIHAADRAVVGHPAALPDQRGQGGQPLDRGEDLVGDRAGGDLAGPAHHRRGAHAALEARAKWPRHGPFEPPMYGARPAGLSLLQTTMVLSAIPAWSMASRTWPVR